MHAQDSYPFTQEMDAADNRKKSTLIIACGALAREIIHVVNHNNLCHIDIKCLPAQLHHQPQLIAGAIRRKIRSNRHLYKKIYVIYGDCGTSGQLDKVLEEEGVDRIAGPHCFSFFMGNEAFVEDQTKALTTFYLTDFFCRFFEKFMWEVYGLDKRKDMVDFVFGNYTRLLFVSQTGNRDLQEQAKKIARRLGLKYEYKYCEYGDLTKALIFSAGASK